MPPSGDRTSHASAPGYGPLLDYAAGLGALVWLAALLAGPLGPIERLLAFGLLVLVPLAVGLTGTPAADGVHAWPYGLACVLLVLAGPLAVAGFRPPRGTATGALLVLPWLGVCGLLALFGFWRLRARWACRGTPFPVEELAIDAGLLYLVVGGGALLLDRLGVALGFAPAIVRLTAVHFHFAGFLLPVLVGVAGRALPDGRVRRCYRPPAGVVIAGPGLIAVGITFSPVVELVAVAAFTAAVAALAGVLLLAVVPRVDARLRRLALACSAVAVAASMALALGYGVGAYLGEPLLGLSIERMVRLHGRTNAYGFALLGVLAWRRAAPPSRVAAPAIALTGLPVRARPGERAIAGGAD